MNTAGSFCPLCKSQKNKSLSMHDIALFRCMDCGIVFNAAHKEIGYNENYFTGMYKEQYGKTYKDDFNNIYAASLRRLNRILKIIRNHDLSNTRLLDIGSAMGFFLKASSDAGIKQVEGIEISAFAAKYCKENYNINVINSSFEDAALRGRYDIITAWYFIEHLKDPSGAIEKIRNSLNPYGIFAFSAPSFFGPQYLFKRAEWINKHPVDHRIDFSPLSVKKILKKAGFSRIYVFPGGIHPERIIPDKLLLKPLKAAYSGISKLISFSDTIEVYALRCPGN